MAGSPFPQIKEEKEIPAIKDNTAFKEYTINFPNNNFSFRQVETSQLIQHRQGGVEGQIRVYIIIWVVHISFISLGSQDKTFQ